MRKLECYQCEKPALELNKNSRCINCVTKTAARNQLENDSLRDMLIKRPVRFQHIDMSNLSRELTEGFINYQFNLDNPMHNQIPNAVYESYTNDRIFRNKVDSIVGGVMQIVDTCRTKE
jgi:ubiquitin C-terminal hydrolase